MILQKDEFKTKDEEEQDKGYMNKEEVLDYLRNANLKEVTPEEIIHNLLQNGEIQLSDYLELQKKIEEAKKPLLEIKLDPEQMIWDITKWLEYCETRGVNHFSSSSDK